VKHIIAIGAELGQLVSSEDLTPLVISGYDRRYKDTAKIQESMAEYAILARQKVATMRLMTTLERIYAVNLTTRATFSADVAESEVPPVVALTSWLINDQGLQYPDYPRSGQPLPAVFYGLNAADVISAIGPDCARCGVPVPLSLWYGNGECYSPYEMLVESDRREAFPFASFCKFSGLTPVDIGADPQADVRLTIELMTRYGLAPLAAEPRMKNQEARASKRKKAVAPTTQP